MKRRLLAALCGIAISFACMIPAGAQSGSAASATINNADLMPKYVPDSQVTVDANGTPDWVKSLIMAEVHLQTATPEGTLQAAVKVLDHYQEMGVNGLWITPVYDPGPTGNGYGNLGPHTIDPKLTGTADYEAGWKELGRFVDEAHKRNIRIILDVISWGTQKGSKLYEQHPDWFSGEAWGGDGFNWANEEFKEWYIQQVVNNALTTGCDGYRYDVEPQYAGYAVHKEIRSRLLAKGRKLLSIGEVANERGGSYDLEQNGVCVDGNLAPEYVKMKPAHLFVDNFNIVDSIKNGQHIGSAYSQSVGDGGGYQYYTHCVSNHDFKNYSMQLNRLAIGYQAIYAPFIPLWYIGDEWNNLREDPLPEVVIYFNKIDWSLKEKPENRQFFEDVKAMIRVRLQNPAIFTQYAEVHRDSNICKVAVTGVEDLQPYARFYGDEAILVIPNYNQHNPDAKMTVYLPFEDMGLDGYGSYTITDAVTGEKVVSGGKSAVTKFDTKVPYMDARVFKVKAAGKIAPTTPATSASTTTTAKATTTRPVTDTTAPSEEPMDTESTVSTEETAASTETEATSAQTETTTAARPVASSDIPTGGDEVSANVLPIVLGVIGGVIVIGAVAAVLILRRRRGAAKP